MREDYGSLNLVTHDDGFGDMGFDTDNPDIMREAIGNEGGLEQVIYSLKYHFNLSIGKLMGLKFLLPKDLKGILFLSNVVRYSLAL